MSTQLVLLAVIFWAVTYPSRAMPLLAPGIDRLPPRALAYLRLVGPAVLSALAASYALVAKTSDGSFALHFGVDVVGVLACLVVVAWRRNLLAGLVVGVALVAIARAAGLA